MQNNKLSITAVFLLIFLIFLYVRPYEIFLALEPLKLARISIILAFLFSLFERHDRTFVIREPSFKIFLGLQVLAIALISISLWKANSFNFLIDLYFKVFVVFYLVIILINNYKKFNTFITVIFICCSIVALRVILAYYNDQIIFDAEGLRRVVGVGTLSSSDPNDVALALGMAFPLGMYLTLARRNLFKKIFYITLSMLIVLAILYTGSRGGYLGFVIGVLVFFSSLYKKKKLQFVFFVVFLSLIAMLCLPQKYKDRFMSTFDTSGYAYTDIRTGRIAIWKRGLEAIAARPQGVGIKNYSLAEGSQKREEGVTGKWMVAHNSYIQIGVELGIIGLLLYIALLISGFRNLRIIARISEKTGDQNARICTCAFYGAMTSFMVSSFFLSQAYYWNHYIFLALIVALKHVVMSDSPQLKSERTA